MSFFDGLNFLKKDDGKKIQNYIVHSNGAIYSINKRRFITGSVQSKGYLQLPDKSLVHRLVARAHLAPPVDTDKTDVNHIDGNKLNNDITNLEWCTKKYNNRHARDLGLR